MMSAIRAGTPRESSVMSASKGGATAMGTVIGAAVGAKIEKELEVWLNARGIPANAVTVIVAVAGAMISTAVAS
jgi:hypothetical protein